MSLLLLFISSLLVNPSPAQAGQDIKVSKIEKFPSSYGQHRPKGASICSGRVDAEKTKKYPWIAEQIADGIDCIAADFDGNGVMDFALLKTGWTSDTSGVGASEIVALMYDAHGLFKALTVSPKHSVFTLEIYPPTGRKGRYGEPITRNPGLVEWGEGDATTVWLFKNGKFESSDYVSEEN